MARGVRYTISSDFDSKGVKAAEKGILALGKSALKATVGITSASVAVAKLNSFLRESVQAALADEKAYAVLGNTLKNAGFDQAADGVKDFIDAQQLATGVAEDQLIPAYTTLFNALQSVSAAQETLQLAQSVAIATGKDLSQVTSAFAKAAKGSNTALQRLNIGLSKAELASSDLDSILKTLEKKFGSTTAAAIDTTTVRMDRLRVAVSEAKEEVGKGLVDAFALLAREGGQDIDELQTKIISIGTTVGDFARGLGVVAEKLTQVANIPINGESLLGRMIKISPSGFIWSKIVEQLVKLGEAERQAAALQNIRGTGYFGLQAQVRAEKAAAAARAKELARQKALEQAKLARERALEAQRKKAAEREAKTKELAQKFDLELIGLAAAKRKTTDEETLNRLTAMQTLALSAYDSEKQSINELDELIKKLTATQNAYTASVIASAAAWGTVPNPNAGSFRLAEQGANQGLGAGSFAPPSAAEFRQADAAMGMPAVTVNVQGSVVAQQDLTQAVLDAVNTATRGGGNLRGLPQAV